MNHKHQFGVHLRLGEILEHEVHHRLGQVKVLFLRPVVQLEEQIEEIVQEDLEHVLVVSEHEEKSLQLLCGRASFGSELPLEISLQSLLYYLHFLLLFFLKILLIGGSILRLLLLLLTFDEVLDLKLLLVNLELMEVLENLRVEIKMQLLDRLLAIANGLQV